MQGVTKTRPGYFLYADDFKRMILGASYFFEREKDKINALNVFPVPDGDTGTNMSMTLNAAVEGSMDYEGQSIGELSKIVASHALMGARGNSGVILSQILRGIAHGLQKKDCISPAELSKAFQYGVVYAYNAVSTPVEGTILTVAREMARGIRNAVRQGETLHKSMEEAIKSGKTALEKTTDMLPALKEAGVVDAGGLGLLVFLEGCLYAMKQSLNDLLHHNKRKFPETTAANTADAFNLNTNSFAAEPLNLPYPYCTEMIIKTESGNFTDLEANLASYGDSLIVASDNRLAKIHIHTASPDLVLQTAFRYGSLHDIKIENMHDQHEQTMSSTPAVEEPTILSNARLVEKGKAGVISVSFGEGFREIFLSIGADKIIFGGQTMNPKVEDLLNAVQDLSQQSVIILPNNKNIIMVAKQLKTLTDKKVEVLDTRTLPEGLAALLAYKSYQPIADNVKSMNQAVNHVKTGLVTYATRDTVIRGSAVKTGQYLGLFGEEIVTSGQELHQAAFELVKEIVEEENDIVTIFYGQDTPRDKALLLANAVAETCPAVEVELQYGGQPIYYYIFSVE